MNNRQYDLVRFLVGPRNQVSVVGDDQQTIYSWRGSNFEIFLGFERDWPKTRVVLLEENYRSTGNIIAAASGLIAQNIRQKPKTLRTKNPAGELVRIVEAADEDGEAFWIAGHLALHLVGAPKGEARGSAAILYRTNAQSRPIEQALIQSRIPYRIYGGLKFYERREIKDALAALRYAANSKDSVSRERLEKTFTKTKFRALDAALTAAEKKPLVVLNAFLEATEYFEYMAKNLTNLSDREENLVELTRFAGEFEELTPLLEAVTLLQATDDKNASGAGRVPVTLMTMHLAKGLEFDRVYVAGCAEGLVPHGRSLGSEAELEEERRLLYVAMTRARFNLTLSFFGIPSRFLSEIPQELITYESLLGSVGDFQNPDLNDEERYITLD